MKKKDYLNSKLNNLVRYEMYLLIIKIVFGIILLATIFAAIKLCL